MAKKAYYSPILLTAGTGEIGMTKSQEGAWGGGNNHSNFMEWWNDPDTQENLNPAYSDFDLNDSSTWPEGFNPGNEDTWELLLE